MAEPVSVTRAGDGVVVVTLDDGKVNVITTPLVRQVAAALDEAERDEGARAVVIAGRPGVFSAGFDLGVMQGEPAAREQMVAGAFELFTRLMTFPKPVVAACTGHAIAAGALLVLAADHRVAADGAYRIGLNEVAIGLPLPGSAVELAAERLSKRHFLRSTLEATLHDPRGALDAGYVDDVVPAAEVPAAATAQAARLAALDPAAFAATKHATRGGTVERMRTHAEADLQWMRSLAGAAG